MLSMQTLRYCNFLQLGQRNIQLFLEADACVVAVSQKVYISANKANLRIYLKSLVMRTWKSN